MQQHTIIQETRENRMHNIFFKNWEPYQFIALIRDIHTKAQEREREVGVLSHEQFLFFNRRCPQFRVQFLRLAFRLRLRARLAWFPLSTAILVTLFPNSTEHSIMRNILHKRIIEGILQHNPGSIRSAYIGILVTISPSIPSNSFGMEWMNIVTMPTAPIGPNTTIKFGGFHARVYLSQICEKEKIILRRRTSLNFIIILIITSSIIVFSKIFPYLPRLLMTI